MARTGRLRRSAGVRCRQRLDSDGDGVEDKGRPSKLLPERSEEGEKAGEVRSARLDAPRRQLIDAERVAARVRHVLHLGDERL